MKKVLVVDDSGIIRLQLRQILESAGYKTFEAVDGSQVISNSFHKDYFLKDMDLIIVDMYLKDMYGFQIIEKIISQYPNMLIIVLSVDNKKEDIIKCIELGAKDYILKPIKKKDFLSRIERILPLPKEKTNENTNKYKKENTNKDLKAEVAKQKFDTALRKEIDRSIRGRNPFAVVQYKFEEEPESLKIILDTFTENLRVIDELFQINNNIFLILSMTNKDGEAVVEKKLSKILAKLITNKPHIKKVFFPWDVENKELIKNYKLSEIKEIFFSKLDLE